ncbi:hypothetical protein Holit_03057 [Hollandina sp. SP2]
MRTEGMTGKSFGGNWIGTIKGLYYLDEGTGKEQYPMNKRTIRNGVDREAIREAQRALLADGRV